MSIINPVLEELIIFKKLFVCKDIVSIFAAL